MAGMMEEKRLDNHNMKIEKTEIWISCERPIEGDGTTVRGFFGNRYRNRPEFHGR